MSETIGGRGTGKTHLKHTGDLYGFKHIVVGTQSIMRHQLNEDIQRYEQRYAAYDGPVVASITTAVHTFRACKTPTADEEDCQCKQRPCYLFCVSGFIATDCAAGILGELLDSYRPVSLCTFRFRIKDLPSRSGTVQFEYRQADTSLVRLAFGQMHWMLEREQSYCGSTWAKHSC